MELSGQASEFLKKMRFPNTDELIEQLRDFIRAPAFNGFDHGLNLIEQQCAFGIWELQPRFSCQQRIHPIFLSGGFFAFKDSL